MEIKEIECLIRFAPFCFSGIACLTGKRFFSSTILQFHPANPQRELTTENQIAVS